MRKGRRLGDPEFVVPTILYLQVLPKSAYGEDISQLFSSLAAQVLHFQIQIVSTDSSFSA